MNSLTEPRLFGSPKKQNKTKTSWLNSKNPLFYTKLIKTQYNICSNYNECLHQKIDILLLITNEEDFLRIGNLFIFS